MAIGVTTAAASMAVALVLIAGPDHQGPRVGRQRRLHPVRGALLLHRRAALRDRPARRVRRPHLHGGAPPPALRRPPGLPLRRGPEVTAVPRPPATGHRPRCLVFGYHTMGCVGFDALLRHGFEVAAVFTHRDDPNEEIWWESLAGRAAGRCDPGAPAGEGGSEDPMPSRTWWLGTGRISSSPSTSAGMIPHPGARARAARGVQPARLAAAALPRPRPGQLGAGQRRDARPASRCTTWSPSPTPATSWTRSAVAIAVDDTALTLYRKLEPAAERLLDRALPLLREGRAHLRPAGPRRRARTSAAAPRRTAASTGAGRRSGSTTSSAP